MSIKEILLDGNNGVNEDGDVVPIEHFKWQPQEAFEFDHYRGEALDTTAANNSDSVLSTQKPEYCGASVSIRERSIAIEAIMKYFNQTNKRIGLGKSRGYNDFDARYGGEANEVAGNMSAKENRLHAEFTKSVDVLMARDGMIEARFASQDIDVGKQQLIRDLYQEYGPGRARAAKRDKLNRSVNKTVRVAVDGKKR